MRFGFMGRILSYDGFGMQTFLSGLLQGIVETRPSHQIYLFLDKRQSAPFDTMPENWQIARSPFATTGAVAKMLWDHLWIGATCRRLHIDALYAPAHIRPFYVPCPTLVSVFDMMYHKFPEQWNLGERLYFTICVSRLTSKATAIAALSENTKRDILEILRVAPEKVEVIYPGVPEGFQRMTPAESDFIRQKYDLPRPFILFVGSFHPRKNLVRVIQAFESIMADIPHDLVIVGLSIWQNQAVTTLLQAEKNAQRIRLIGFVPRDELTAFYNACAVFVFPSLYEGFGFPVLEALACGCPVITSNTSALPEVVGDAAWLVNPTDGKALAEAMLKLTQDIVLRDTLAQRATTQLAKFSWHVTAIKTLDMLERIAA